MIPFFFFFCSVFLWIVKFHFLYLPPVFAPSYWELHAFSTLSYKRYPTEFVVDPVVLLWRVSLIVFYTRQQWRIWIATDRRSLSCFVFGMSRVQFSARRLSCLGAGAGVGSWISSDPPRKCTELGRYRCLLHPFQFTAHGANFIHVGLTH